MAKKWPATEKDLLLPVVGELKRNGWEVFEELSPYGYADAMDILAVKGKVLWAIEGKRQFSFRLLEQACRWKRRCHYVSICTPYSRNNYSTSIKQRILHDMGIGWLEARCQSFRFAEGDVISTFEHVRPKLSRRVCSDDIWQAVENQRELGNNCAAGEQTGARLTPFAATIKRIKSYLRRNPPHRATVDDVLAECDHHWASQRSGKACLIRYIKKGIVKGLSLERSGKKLVVVLSECE